MLKYVSDTVVLTDADVWLWWFIIDRIYCLLLSVIVAKVFSNEGLLLFILLMWVLNLSHLLCCEWVWAIYACSFFIGHWYDLLFLFHQDLSGDSHPQDGLSICLYLVSVRSDV